MANITKKDLVEKISTTTGLTQVDTKIVVESFLEAVSRALREGKNIEIRGFGRFKIKEKKARMARNPGPTFISRSRLDTSRFLKLQRNCENALTICIGKTFPVPL